MELKQAKCALRRIRHCQLPLHTLSASCGIRTYDRCVAYEIFVGTDIEVVSEFGSALEQSYEIYGCISPLLTAEIQSFLR